VFTHRRIEPGDLEACVRLLRDGFAFQPADGARLIALWQLLLRGKAWATVAVEDSRLPARDRLVGIGMSVFVTDAFAQRARAGLPLLSRAFLEQHEAGERPFLSREEVAAANAGSGLNLMVLHYGFSKRLGPQELTRVQLLQTERFVAEHAGYQVKEYLHEVFGEELQFVLAAGSLLRHGYREPQWRQALAGVPEADWPSLTGYRPEELAARAGTAASMMQAKSTPPRFGFSPAEQALLAHALEARTDEELAAALGVSPWTVKKRWQAVYLKVEQADRRLFASRERGPRSPQRRRHLLAYLRDHPEELRPFRRR
jgi:DNA-binding CsgD family transcriptional regulator